MKIFLQKGSTYLLINGLVLAACGLFFVHGGVETLSQYDEIMAEAYEEYGDIFNSTYPLVTAEQYASQVTGIAVIETLIGFSFMTIGLLGVLFRNDYTKAGMLWVLGIVGACLATATFMLTTYYLLNTAIFIMIFFYLIVVSLNKKKDMGEMIS